MQRSAKPSTSTSTSTSTLPTREQLDAALVPLLAVDPEHQRFAEALRAARAALEPEFTPAVLAHADALTDQLVYDLTHESRILFETGRALGAAEALAGLQSDRGTPSTRAVAGLLGDPEGEPTVLALRMAVSHP